MCSRSGSLQLFLGMSAISRLMRWAALILIAALLSGCITPVAPPAIPQPDLETRSTAPVVTTTAVEASTQPVAGLVRVHYVDVGQGDGTIWQLPDGTVIVYDCGDRSTSSSSNPMNRFLREEMGMLPGARIHALIASHGHLDHVGGCQEILDDYVVEHLYDTWYPGGDAPETYEGFRQQARAESGVIHVLRDDAALEGDELFSRWDDLALPATAIAKGVRAQIIWPGIEVSRWDDVGHESIGVRLSFGATDFCFQGDIETQQEAQLANSFSGLDCEVYLVGHHGSAQASSATWLTKMDPEVAVVSFGENSYGHPTSAALCRVQNAGAAIYATHRLRDITVETDGNAIAVTPAMSETKDYCANDSTYWAEAAPTTASSSAPPADPPAEDYNVEITHIEADPEGTDGIRYNDEWIEVTNLGSDDVSMTGWRVKDNAPSSPATYSFPSGFVLAAGATVTVHTGSGTNTDAHLYWGKSQFVWNNSGDVGHLYKGSVLVHEYSYGSP